MFEFQTDQTLRVEISPKTKVVGTCMQYTGISGIKKRNICHHKQDKISFHGGLILTFENLNSLVVKKSNIFLTQILPAMP